MQRFEIEVANYADDLIGCAEIKDSPDLVAQCLLRCFPSHPLDECLVDDHCRGIAGDVLRKGTTGNDVYPERRGKIEITKCIRVVDTLRGLRTDCLEGRSGELAARHGKRSADG